VHVGNAVAFVADLPLDVDVLTADDSLHKAELAANWPLAQNKRPLQTIEPLE